MGEHKTAISFEDAETLAYDYNTNEAGGFRFVKRYFSHTTRWSTYDVVIIQDLATSCLFEFVWGEGKTESQESPMWGDDVEVFDVEAYEETVTKYRRIK